MPFAFPIAIFNLADSALNEMAAMQLEALSDAMSQTLVRGHRLI
jgi:hypothetical protein